MTIKRGKQVTFVYSPRNHCERVEVAGSFNEWRPHEGRMTRQKDGTYRKRLQLAPGEYRYKYLVDGQWELDNEAEGQVPNTFGSLDSLVRID
ncbi:MAG TPA: isoamylase early set domain-containing protein [Phycisphaerae bacterium]|nr:isoamylase early set domain-containing protein [Phycisphaerae bacterium]HOW70550.1 isoamylase early set domain-containing protein [Phycisphaerae bacterium]HRY68657.1 isoamylase early set domain-containing protein [Phycisphaerae bacterium]HSA25483.1 isoamylase early set domain-containing protein [Phycisphaerae bacterium]